MNSGSGPSRASTSRVATMALAAVLVGVVAGFAIGGREPATERDDEVASADPQPTNTDALGAYVVMGYNDLGMHCMNDDFSEICVLPPYNNLHAQVIRRGDGPEIMHSGVTVRYWIPSNTESASKSNFWRFAPALFGVALAPDVGLTGHGMAGTMSPAPGGDWSVTGIPITPTEDSGRENPYPLATITVIRNGAEVARTQAVVPVSTEVSCNLCHNTPGISPATDLLRAHDTLHGTNLEASKPVLCASCHASNALGTPGAPGVPNMSSAIHTAHASRMAPAASLESVCYACHPGIRTSCQRDVHLAAGMRCTECHGQMEDVGNPARRPWIDEPRCSECHKRPGFDFEQADTLYRDSRGHSGVRCSACHGSPHAIGPTVTAVDNLQAIALQGHPGKIDTCAVCHTQQPGDPFFHRVSHDIGGEDDPAAAPAGRLESSEALSATTTGGDHENR